MQAPPIFGVIALGCVYFGCRAPVPELPNVNASQFAPAVRTHVEAAYEKARRQPGDPSAVGELGMVLDAHKQASAAVAAYERARALDPQSFRWTYYLGSALAGQGRHEQAVSTLQIAARLDPTYVPARMKLAESLLESGQWVQSEKIFREVLQSRPGEARAWYGLGRSLAAQGKDDGAADSYRKACEFFPGYGSSNYALALLLKKQGRDADAAPYFRQYERARTSAPPVDDPLAAAVSELDVSAASRLRKAISLQEAGHIEEAAAELEGVVNEDPKSVQAHTNLITLYGRLSKFGQAERHFRTVTALDAHQVDAYYNYGVALCAQEKWSEAKRVFQQAIDINPLHAEAQHNLGSLLEQEGKLDQALGRYLKALEAKPDYRLAHFRAGRILVNQRKYEAAISHFLKTLTPADQNTPSYLYALAATYARSGDKARALEYARQARQSAARLGQSELIASIDRAFGPIESAH